MCALVCQLSMGLRVRRLWIACAYPHVYVCACVSRDALVPWVSLHGCEAGGWNEGVARGRGSPSDGSNFIPNFLLRLLKTCKLALVDGWVGCCAVSRVCVSLKISVLVGHLRRTAPDLVFAWGGTGGGTYLLEGRAPDG